MIQHYTDWDEFKNAQLCSAWVATAIIGGSLVSAGSSIFGSNKAAKAQTDAANASIAEQRRQYDQTSAYLSPYRDIGSTAATQLTNQLPSLTAPINMDQATLEKTPGYQFNLTQGLKATQNSAAARGLGVSGAALKGAANFATGLADNTYQQQFQNANTNQTNAFNRLSTLVNTGETAAAGTGVIGANTANQISSSLTGAGNAQAAAANQSAGAISNLGNLATGYGIYKGLYGSSAGPTGNVSTTNFDGSQAAA